jgi:rhamnosyltransferase
MAQICGEIVFISDRDLSGHEREKIAGSVNRVIASESSESSFTAWRDGLNEYGLEKLAKYDEVILADNSCYGPIFPLEPMFSKMKGSDFWGVTAFPDGGTTPQRLQSYFLVLGQSIIASPGFSQFWKGARAGDARAYGEADFVARLTDYLNRYRLTPDCYVPESLYLTRSGIPGPVNGAIYSMPTELLKLRCPFVKKEFLRHISDIEEVSIVDAISKLSDYPIEYIKADLSEV